MVSKESCEHPDRQNLWKKLEHVPRQFRALGIKVAGHKESLQLTLEECNRIYKELAPKYDMNYLKARTHFAKEKGAELWARAVHGLS